MTQTTWKSISIRQPWAWAILNGKDVENRDWRTSFRGRVLLHASKNMLSKQGRRDELESIFEICPALAELWPGFDKMELGGIVGEMTITGCRLNELDAPKSRWEVPGAYSLVLEHVRPLPFTPCSGTLGFWNVPQDIVSKLHRHLIVNAEALQ